jgi:putative endonuclease
VVRVKDAVGRYGEQVAARHLEDAGMTILDRNWRCAEGEIDIVASDGDTLVVCEVKTRSGLAFGDPAEAVVPAKAARLRRLALRWLASHGLGWRDLRFDVVTVLRRAEGGPLVRHLRGAF